MTTYGIYYESPEGGGNLQYTTKDGAIAEFAKFQRAYPDMYLALYESYGDDWRTADSKCIREYDPSKKI